MPREQITERHTKPTENPNVFAEQPRRHVHIGWDRSGWVQIGIDVSIGELRHMLTAAETEAAAEARKLAAMGELDVEAFTFRVHSDVLDRAEVNASVRTLRRARNAAYGADE